MHITWVLIANASEARLFKVEKKARNEKLNNANNMKLIEEFFHPASREKIINLVSSMPGRYPSSGNAPSGFYEETTNPKEVEAERFAHKLALKLDKGRTSNLYSNLIVIAPPHFQGLLRKSCNHQVNNRVITRLDKDYTKIREHDLSHYLDGKITSTLRQAM